MDSAIIVYLFNSVCEAQAAVRVNPPAGKHIEFLAIENAPDSGKLVIPSLGSVSMTLFLDPSDGPGITAVDVIAVRNDDGTLYRR